jgi:uncharacterized membrane protein
MAVNERRPHYVRHSAGLEFDRFVFFSDAVFAIAMTLLVVGISVPHGASRNLEHALSEKTDEIFSFIISFLVIGYYWLAHHRFVALIGRVDTAFMVINLGFLAAIAFTPFPTALVGVYSGQEISVVLYCATLAAASLLMVLMLARAYSGKLFRGPMTPEYYRFSLLASSAPVAAFLLAIPIAYVDTSLALPFLLVLFPVEHLLDRFVKPPEEEIRSSG